MSWVALALWLGCGKPEGIPGPQAKGGGARVIAYPVEVDQVEARQVEFAINAVGSVDAFETVQMTARVAGAVEKVRFFEGQAVKAGEVLVEIEPQRYELAVRAAQATLQKAKASEAEANAGLQRREQVEKANPGLIRGEEVDTFRTHAMGAAADASQAQVALEQAQLNLHDAYVRAPVSGILQTRSVMTGQYVQPGAVLATMLRRDPLLLRFQVTEAEAARISVGMTARFSVKSGAQASAARITHVAAEASSASRMVPITAEVDDKGDLRPGSFAEVVVPVGQVTAPVVPQTAVRPSARGFLAYVVEDGKAKERVLTLGMRTPDGLVEVRSGVRPGDKLVVRGSEALKDGVSVSVKGEAKAIAGGSAG